MRRWGRRAAVGLALVALVAAALGATIDPFGEDDWVPVAGPPAGEPADPQSHPPAGEPGQEAGALPDQPPEPPPDTDTTGADEPSPATGEAVQPPLNAPPDPAATIGQPAGGQEQPASVSPAATAAVHLLPPEEDPILTPAAKAYLRKRRPLVLAKGLYLSGYSASQPATIRAMITLLDRTELNALVIDVKDDNGRLTYRSALPEAQAAGAVWGSIEDLRGMLKEFKQHGIYSIARVVTFKDNKMPRYQPGMAVLNKGGGLWQDYNEQTWLNPYSQEAWDYLVAVAREVARLGFDEIQFDYVRFPTDGPMSQVVYPGQDSRSKDEVIADFLAYARQELRKEGVFVSADIFGIVLTAADGQGIGQQLEEVAAGPHILSPMIYPSHYGPWNLGLPNPNAEPYETIYRSLSKGQERLAATGVKVRFRPWLQDFTLGQPPYGPAEVRAQIKAVEDLGIQEWLLWNAGNRYTEAALAPHQPTGGQQTAEIPGGTQ